MAAGGATGESGGDITSPGIMGRTLTAAHTHNMLHTHNMSQEGEGEREGRDREKEKERERNRQRKRERLTSGLGGLSVGAVVTPDTSTPPQSAGQLRGTLHFLGVKGQMLHQSVLVPL